MRRLPNSFEPVCFGYGPHPGCNHHHQDDISFLVANPELNLHLPGGHTQGIPTYLSTNIPFILSTKIKEPKKVSSNSLSKTAEREFPRSKISLYLLSVLVLGVFHIIYIYTHNIYIYQNVTTTPTKHGATKKSGHHSPT